MRQKTCGRYLERWPRFKLPNWNLKPADACTLSCDPREIEIRPGEPSRYSNRMPSPSRATRSPPLRRPTADAVGYCLVAATAAGWMPRACPVEAHVSRYTGRRPPSPRFGRGGFAAAAEAGRRRQFRGFRLVANMAPRGQAPAVARKRTDSRCPEGSHTNQPSPGGGPQTHGQSLPRRGPHKSAQGQGPASPASVAAALGIRSH